MEEERRSSRYRSLLLSVPLPSFPPSLLSPLLLLLLESTIKNTISNLERPPLCKIGLETLT